MFMLDDLMDVVQSAFSIYSSICYKIIAFDAQDPSLIAVQ